MLYQSIPCTVFYLENSKELDEKFSNISLDRRMLIKNIKKEKTYISRRRYVTYGYIQKDV